MAKDNNFKTMKPKKKIVNSLIILLRLKPYASITVTEVCKVAKVNRQTFYNN